MSEEKQTDWALALPDDNEIQAQLMVGFAAEFLDATPETFVVTCEDTAKQALSYSLQARKLKSRIEDSRKEIVRPHIDFQKAVMKFAKDFNEKLDNIESTLHVKIHDWMKKQKDNPFACVDELKVEDGTITCKTNWDFEVQDDREVPREYLQVDAGAIEKAIKNGVRKIPGVRIFSYETTSLRVKN